MTKQKANYQISQASILTLADFFNRNDITTRISRDLV